jgi:hypothetical protein
MTMSYEERSLDTDVIEAPAGYVVTGVRLRKLDGHVNLEVRVSFVRRFRPGANPTTSSYNATDSLARFENKENCF